MTQTVIQELECIQCDKCTHFCPVHRVDVTYSPRRMMLQLFKDGIEPNLNDPNIWQCLTCYQCREICPSNTKYVDVVLSLRQKAQKTETDSGNFCKHGYVLRTLQRIMANTNLEQKKLSFLDGKKFAKTGDPYFFIGCSPIHNNLFDHTDSIKTTIDALTIFEKLGVTPSVSNDEKCCGYDLYWNGDEENFKKLVKHNVEVLGKTGAKTIITACAEGYITLKELYPQYSDNFKYNVLHISQYLAQLFNEGKLKLNKSDKKVTYHDPCRLGRHGAEYDAPRTLLKAICGDNFKEMERIRENSLCCGVGNFSLCGENTKFIQNDRLKEAKETGAEILITTCPKCQIHFNCYITGKPIEPIENLEIMDLTSFVAQNLN